MQKDTITGLEAMREDMDLRFQDETVGDFPAKIEFDSDNVLSYEAQRINEFFSEFEYASPPLEEVQTLRKLEQHIQKRNKTKKLEMFMRKKSSEKKRQEMFAARNSQLERINEQQSDDGKKRYALS